MVPGAGVDVHGTAGLVLHGGTFLPIKPGNVLVGTFLGLTEATSVEPPLSGPMTLDSWISAAQGDPSGLWLLSTMAGLDLPQSFVWGEFASIGLADAQPAERYFSSGAGGGSIIGNPFTEFLWGAGGLAHWPANPGENQYTSVQNSNVPTLLFPPARTTSHPETTPAWSRSASPRPAGSSAWPPRP